MVFLILLIISIIFTQQGQHRFSFSLRIPDESLPSSFIGEYGNVRYYMKAKFVMQDVMKRMISKFNGLEEREIFYVKRKVDLNLHPEARKQG